MLRNTAPVERARAPCPILLNPANDNPAGPEGDGWPWLIARIALVSERMAVIASRYRHQGSTARQFSELMICAFSPAEVDRHGR